MATKKLILVLVCVIVAAAAGYMVYQKKQIEKQHQQELAEQANAKDPWTEANEQWLADLAKEEGVQKTRAASSTRC